MSQHIKVSLVLRKIQDRANKEVTLLEQGLHAKEVCTLPGSCRKYKILPSPCTLKLINDVKKLS